MKLENMTNVDVVRHTVRVDAICSIGRAPFRAVVAVEYGPADWLLEFMAYEQWLKKFASVGSTTIEELCDNVFDHLWELLDPDNLSVRVDGVTEAHSPASATRKEWC